MMSSPFLASALLVSAAKKFAPFLFFSVLQVGAALMGDTAGTNPVSRPKHGV